MDFILSHRPGNSDITDSIWDKHLLKFNAFHSGIKILKQSLSEFIKEISNTFKTKVHHYDMGYYNYYILVNEDIFISLQSGKETYNSEIYCKDYDLLDRIYEITKKYKSFDDNDYINLTTVGLMQGGIKESSEEKYHEDFSNIDKDFYPFIDVNLFIEQFIKSNENILILASEPGTGKSKFIALLMRYLLENNTLPDSRKYHNFLFAKDISLFNMDDFWEIAKRNDYLILDDLDFLLGKRDDSRDDVSKNNFLSKLLSFSDGVIKNDTKIIITTNQPIDEIDEALKRKGRLFDFLKFLPLEYKEAQKIYAKHTDKKLPYKDIYYQSDLGSMIDDVKNDIIDRKYLKKNVSLLHKKIEKKVGFV